MFTSDLNSSPKSLTTLYKASRKRSSRTLFGSSLTSLKLDMYFACFSNSRWRLSIELRHKVTLGVRSSGLDSTLVRFYSALAWRIFDKCERIVLFESAGAVRLLIRFI